MDCKENCLHCDDKCNTKSNTNQHGNCELKDEEIIKGYCNKKLCPTAQEIINRQKAEIERLQKAIKVQDIIIEQQDYKIKSTKSEAIKELFEKIKKEKMTHRNLGEIVYIEVIEELLKEMVGENNV